MAKYKPICMSNCKNVSIAARKTNKRMDLTTLFDMVDWIYNAA